MACDVPFSEAPGLFAYDETNHCYVKRQPATKEEVEPTLRAAWLAELECIRYRGADRQVLRRFAEFAAPQLCDVAPPPEFEAIVRNVVTFDTSSVDAALLSALDLADAFGNYLLHRNREREQFGSDYRYRIEPVVGDDRVASLAFSWFEGERHTVEVRRNGSAHGRWLARHFSAESGAGRGLSNVLNNWLKSAAVFGHIRWYSDKQFAAGEAGCESPI